MLETMFGLANLGYVDEKGMPGLLQMVMVGREFSDTVQFKSPPPALGYRGTYPQISRSQGGGLASRGRRGAAA